VAIDDGHILIVDSALDGNSANDFSRAAEGFPSQGKLELRRSTVSGNTVTFSGDGGGFSSTGGAGCPSSTARSAELGGRGRIWCVDSSR
jgi:hypothetical protein